MDEYYIVAFGSEELGPLSLADLNAKAQAGQISAETQVRCPGGFVVPASMVSGIEGLCARIQQNLPEYVPPIPVQIEEPKGSIPGFNFGALCLTWIWGIYHRSVLTLILLFVDIASVVVAWFVFAKGLAPDVLGLCYTARIVPMVWFGVQGNSWAWQSGRYETVDQMKKAQKKWAIWGGACAVLIASLAFVGLVYGIYFIETQLHILNELSNPSSGGE